jgi:hypothetical protein
MLYPNKRSGTCVTCKAKVAVGAGVISKNSAGRWDVYHNSDQCIPADLQAKNAQKNRKELTANGELYFPYDAAALPLLRAFPPTRDRSLEVWDKKKGCRHVSLDAGDRMRVLELCAKLGVPVADELKEIPKDESALDALARANAVTTLRDFQLPGVEFLARRRRAVLGDDMGLGKTFQALLAADPNMGLLVVCPSSLKYNWADEVRKWRPDLTPEVMEGRGNFRFPKAGEVVITNFEILPKWLLPVTVATKEVRGKTVEIKAAQVPALPSFRGINTKNIILIVDECQRAKNSKSQLHKKVKELARICGRTWFLTGTPLMSRPLDLWNVLQAGHMAHDVFGGWGDGTWGFTGAFRARKVRVSRYQTVWQWGTPTEDTPERLRRVMLRRLKDGVLDDLPPTVWSDLVVDVKGVRFTRELTKLYERFEDELTQGRLPRFEELSDARAKLAESRIPAMLDMVQDYEEAGEPLVVFSAYKAPINKLGERDGWAIITGDVPAARRQEIVRDFQAGRLKGIGLTIAAGGVGITLTKASNVLFVDLDWVPANNAQAVDRIRRIGQNADSIQVMRMVSNHPVDRRVHQILAIKMELIQKAIDTQVEYDTANTPSGVTIKTESKEDFDARIARIAAAAAQVARDEAKLRVTGSGWLSGERQKAQRPEVPITPPVAVSLRDALTFMLNRCDGAQARDDVGFSKPDAGRARVLAETGLTTEDELRTAERLLSRYYRQLHNTYPILFS